MNAADLDAWDAALARICGEPASVPKPLERAPLEEAFLDPDRCATCGAKHAGWGTRCPICEDQHQRESALYRSGP